MKERDIQNMIRIEMAQHGCRLWRNNVGTLKDRTGKHVTFGLATGSSDLVGFTIIEGRAIFTAVEVKRPGKKTAAKQAAFLAMVAMAGGISCMATSPNDVIDEIGRYVR